MTLPQKDEPRPSPPVVPPQCGTASPGEAFTFPKTARLLESRQYKRVLSKGRKFFCAAALLHVAPGETETSRMGLTVSRKVGNATVRNRVKRIARECFRLLRPRLRRPVDCVLVARPQARDLNKTELAALLAQLFEGSLDKPR